MEKRKVRLEIMKGIIAYLSVFLSIVMIILSWNDLGKAITLGAILPVIICSFLEEIERKHENICYIRKTYSLERNSYKRLEHYYIRQIYAKKDINFFVKTMNILNKENDSVLKKFSLSNKVSTNDFFSIVRAFDDSLTNLLKAFDCQLYLYCGFDGKLFWCVKNSEDRIIYKKKIKDSTQYRALRSGLIWAKIN